MDVDDTFAYEDSMQCRAHSKRTVLLRIPRSLYLLDIKGAEDDVSRSTVTPEMKVAGNENGSMDFRLDCSVRTPVEGN